MTDPDTESGTDSSGEVVSGELLDSGSERDSEPDATDGSHEEIDQPTRLLRIAGMVKGLLTEVETTELDEAARERLGTIHSRAVDMLREIMSEDLAAELDDLAPRFAGDVPTGAELRVAQAQLAGWLEGLFHGIQASMASQRAMGRRPGSLPGADKEGASPGSSTTGQYL